MDYVISFTWASMVLSLAAALCWLRSATVRIKPLPEGQDCGHPEIIVKGYAVNATAIRQGVWSSWGAGFAAAAALCHAVALLAAR